MDTVKLHCLCKYTINTQTLNSESRLISSLLKIYANCPDSQPRNKAKNALSLASRFLPAWRGKDTKKMENARNFRKKSIIAV